MHNMKNTKMFYTVKELQQLSSEEIIELTSFNNGGEAVFYYSEIERINDDIDGEYIIIFKSGEAFFTENLDIIKTIKFNKARFDLLTKSLEQVQKEKDDHIEFYDTIKSDISDEMLRVHNTIQINRKNFDIMIKSLQKTLEEKITNSINKMDYHVKELNAVDIDKFNTLMKKIELITEAFSELLEK